MSIYRGEDILVYRYFVLVQLSCFLSIAKCRSCSQCTYNMVIDRTNRGTKLFELVTPVAALYVSGLRL